jgi:hypothetical protein
MMKTIRFVLLTALLSAASFAQISNGGGGGSGTVGPGTQNKITKFGTTTTVADSSITDDGSTVSTTEPIVTTSTIAAGSSPPACTAGTAGAWCGTEGSAFTNVASTGGCWFDSTTHEVMCKTNGASTGGMQIRQQPGAVNLTGQTATKSISTLCAASAGACNQAGQYHVHFNFWQSGTACSSVTAGSVTFALTWVDENAVTHSAVIIPMMNQTGATSVAVGNSFTFATAHANAGASGDFTISTNGSVIQYTATYTACTTGTGTYNLRATVTRVQ